MSHTCIKYNLCYNTIYLLKNSESSQSTSCFEISFSYQDLEKTYRCTISSLKSMIKCPKDYFINLKLAMSMGQLQSCTNLPNISSMQVLSNTCMMSIDNLKLCQHRYDGNEVEDSTKCHIYYNFEYLQIILINVTMV